MASQTLATALDASGGRPSGFDYIRIGLAMSVVVMHSTITSYGDQADFELWTSFARPLLRAIIPMFFALSGFLVGGSLYRCASLISFLGLRVLRVYPALMIEVIVSALVLGPLVTSLPLKEYIYQPEFREYLLNATGHIHYLLPGVFEANPYPRIVNAQLWTVPYELYCYLVLASLVILKIKNYPWMAPAAAVAICVAHLCGKFVKNGAGMDFFILGALPGPLLISCFLVGLSLYIHREKVPVNPGLIMGMAILSSALLCIPGGEYPATLTLAYVTISLGVMNPRRVNLIKSADYSYGIYLYGFVVQQTLMCLFPNLRSAVLNVAMAVPATAALSWLSWTFVERPVFRLKAPLYALEKLLLAKRSFRFLGSAGSADLDPVRAEPSPARTTN